MVDDMVERTSDEERAVYFASLDARAAELSKLGSTCWYCGPLRGEVTITEHVTPRSRGGTDTGNNIVGACRSCNRIKSFRTLEEFRALLAERNDVPPDKVAFYGELAGNEWLAPKLDPPPPLRPFDRMGSLIRREIEGL